MSFPHTPEETRLKPYICSRSRALLHTYAYAYAYALPYMMKPSRSFLAACHHHHHHVARFTLARSFFCYRERQSWHVLLLACLLILAKSVSETHRLPYSSTYLPIHQPPRGRRREGKGRDNKRGKELFFSIEKFRLSLWIKKTEWHGTSLWAGFSFFFFSFSFSFSLSLSLSFFFSYTYRHAPLDYLADASLSLSLSLLLLTFGRQGQWRLASSRGE